MCRGVMWAISRPGLVNKQTNKQTPNALLVFPACSLPLTCSPGWRNHGRVQSLWGWESHRLDGTWAPEWLCGTEHSHPSSPCTIHSDLGAEGEINLWEVKPLTFRGCFLQQLAFPNWYNFPQEIERRAKHCVSQANEEFLGPMSPGCLFPMDLPCPLISF